MISQSGSTNWKIYEGYREEKDTFGPIQVPADRLWAAQTQRSMQNFDIARDTDRMPIPIIRAFGILKKCAAKVNVKYGLPQNICKEFFDFSWSNHQGSRLSNRRKAWRSFSLSYLADRLRNSV